MKISFFDIDGTLIHVPSGIMTPTKPVRHALEQFRKQGNQIIIASARGEVPKAMQDMEFDGYICSDGHYIRYRGEVLADDLFEENQVQRMIDVFEKYHGKPEFYGHHDMWCSCLDDEYVIKHRVHFQGTDKRPEGVHEDYRASDVHAISCCVMFANVEDLMSAYHELKDDFRVVYYDTGIIRMDIYNLGHSKGTACEYLYKKLGVNFEDTYAFGDGVNDQEMLQLVKHGIAMGNAEESIKKIAYEVIDTVQNDGIAKYFEKEFGIVYDK